MLKLSVTTFAAGTCRAATYAVPTATDWVSAAFITTASWLATMPRCGGADTHGHGSFPASSVRAPIARPQSSEVTMMIVRVRASQRECMTMARGASVRGGEEKENARKAGNPGAGCDPDSRGSESGHQCTKCVSLASYLGLASEFAIVRPKYVHTRLSLHYTTLL